MLRLLRAVPGLVLLTLLVAYLGVSLLMAQGASRAERRPQVAHPADLGLAYQDVSFLSRRGDVVLEGWYLPGAEPAGASVIFVHGLGSTRSGEDALDLAAALVARSFNVLLFDLRAHGSSGGNRVAAGSKERSDVQGAVDFLLAHGATFGRVGLVGFSFGAGTALLAAAGEPAIGAVVADSPFARASDLIEQETARKTPFPRWLVPFFVPAADLLARLAYGIDLREAVPEAAAAQLTYPLLIIHGEADQRIPVSHALRVHAASPPGSQLWTLPGVGHVGAYEADRSEYERRVIAYLEDRLR